MSIRIGIDLGGTKIEGIAFDGSDEVARMRRDTPRDDYPATVEGVAAVVEALEQRVGDVLGVAKGSRGSVGVGIPGTLSLATGLVKNANSVWLIGRPLLADLERRLGREVRIANDANCFAASEAADGAGAGAEVVFGVIVGTGTGAGIIVRGHVVTGANGIAGEWGHNPLPWAADDERPGPGCYCGRHGCIETFLSGPGMQADYERRTLRQAQGVAGTRRQPAEIVVDAAAGDRAAQDALARYEERMARALASVVNVLDPDVIVLGGGMSNIASLYDHVPKLWGQYIFACGANASPPDLPIPNAQSRLGVGSLGVGRDEPVRTRLVRARHGDASGVRGAAWLWPGG
jgi:fructokinase